MIDGVAACSHLHCDTDWPTANNPLIRIHAQLTSRETLVRIVGEARDRRSILLVNRNHKMGATSLRGLAIHFPIRRDPVLSQHHVFSPRKVISCEPCRNNLHREKIIIDVTKRISLLSISITFFWLLYKNEIVIAIRAYTAIVSNITATFIVKNHSFNCPFQHFFFTKKKKKNSISYRNLLEHGLERKIF